jgi:hypothetical protein
MKSPFYILFSMLAFGWLVMSNLRGWSLIQSSANRSSLTNTSYRYRPSINSSSSSGWSFGHK